MANVATAISKYAISTLPILYSFQMRLPKFKCSFLKQPGLQSTVLSITTERTLSTKEPIDFDDNYVVDERKFKNKKITSVKVLESVGKFIPHDTLDLTHPNGEKHVGISRKEAMHISQQLNLKLVLVNAKSKPNPSYNLMSGDELHRERMKAKEMHKEKKSTETKEMTISDNISHHDLQVKKKQILNWMENSEHQYHVRITVTHKKSATENPSDDKMKIINEILSSLKDVTVNGPPKKFGKTGESMRVTLRHMSAKEKIKHKKEIQ